MIKDISRSEVLPSVSESWIPGSQRFGRRHIPLKSVAILVKSVMLSSTKLSCPSAFLKHRRQRRRRDTHERDAGCNSISHNQGSPGASPEAGVNKRDQRWSSARLRYELDGRAQPVKTQPATVLQRFDGQSMSSQAKPRESNGHKLEVWKVMPSKCHYKWIRDENKAAQRKN